MIGRAAPELGDRVPSFSTGGYSLTPLTFVRYARVETKLTELLGEIRKLSLELRRAAVQADTAREYDLLEDKWVREIDTLFARLGQMTAGDFVRDARALRPTFSAISGNCGAVTTAKPSRLDLASFAMGKEPITTSKPKGWKTAPEPATCLFMATALPLLVRLSPTGAKSWGEGSIHRAGYGGPSQES